MISVTDESGRCIDTTCRCNHVAAEHLWAIGDGWFELGRCQTSGCDCGGFDAPMVMVKIEYNDQEWVPLGVYEAGPDNSIA
jgi:hypothetical protein